MTGSKLSLFADCLLAGVLVALTAVPVITAYPGFVAACSILRSSDSFSIKVYLGRLGQVVQSGLAGMLVPPAVAGLLLLDGAAIGAGPPGSVAFGPVLAMAGVVLAVLGLRVAGRWSPGARWRAVVPAAGRDLVGDVRGSLLLGLAVVTAAGLTVLVPVTLLLLGGVLALAAAAVGSRVEVVSS